MEDLDLGASAWAPPISQALEALTQYLCCRCAELGARIEVHRAEVEDLDLGGERLGTLKHPSDCQKP